MNEPVKQLQLCEICHTRPRYHDGVSVCAVCMGLEQGEEETVQSKVASAPELHEAGMHKSERPCSNCGRTPSQTKFYPSRPDKCVECIKARQAGQAAQETKTYTPIEITTKPPEIDPIVSAEIHAMPELPLFDPAEEAAAAMCTCKECGASFQAYNNGVAVIINYCLDCLKKRLKKGLRKAGEIAAPSFKITIDLEQDQDIFEALTLDAKRERRSLENQAITILETVLRGRPQKGITQCGE